MRKLWIVEGSCVIPHWQSKDLGQQRQQWVNDTKRLRCHADQSGPALFRDILGLLRRKKRKILDFLQIWHLVLKQLIENNMNMIIKMNVFLYSCRSHPLKKTTGFWILSQDLLTTHLLSLVSPLQHCLNRRILIKKVSQKCYL